MTKDEIEDRSHVHIFPCDHEEMGRTETSVYVHSVPCGHPEKGGTIPLFTLKEAAEILRDLHELAATD